MFEKLVTIPKIMDEKTGSIQGDSAVFRIN